MQCYLTALLLSSRVFVVLQRQIITLRQGFESLQPCAVGAESESQVAGLVLGGAARIDAEASAGLNYRVASTAWLT